MLATVIVALLAICIAGLLVDWFAGMICLAFLAPVSVALWIAEKACRVPTSKARLSRARDRLWSWTRFA